MRSQGNQELTSSSSPLPSPSWIHDLQELRTSVISRLLAIEEMARRRASTPTSSAETLRLVQSLREKIAELELDRDGQQADAEQGQGDWKRSLAQFEKDRQLLAEAWEKLERERIETGGGTAIGQARPAPAAHSHHRPRVPDDVPAHTYTPLRTAGSGESGNPVAETILRQFQVLCGDVRRTTDARCSSG
jgi:hypothetical protein